MRLRTQLALAFFLLAVVPLLGRDALLLARRRSARSARRWPPRPRRFAARDVDARRRRGRRAEGAAAAHAAPPAGPRREPRTRRPSREALAAAEARRAAAAAAGDPVRRPSAARARSRSRVDAEGRPYAPDPADEAVLEGLGLVPGHPATRRDAGDWVVAERARSRHRHRDRRSRGRSGPRSPRSARTAARNLALGLGLAAPRAARHPAALAADDAPPRLAHRGRRSGSPPATSTCGAGAARPRVPAASPRPSTAWRATCARTRSG